MSQIRRLSDVHIDSIVDTVSLISYQQCVLLLLDFNDNIVLGTIRRPATSVTSPENLKMNVGYINIIYKG